MSEKVVWTGYIDYEISKLVNEIRRKKGWSKTVLIEQAFCALVDREKEKGTLQSAGLSAAEEENGNPLEQTTTRSGYPAVRPKEELYL